VKLPAGVERLGEIAQVETKSASMFVIDLIHAPDYVKPVYEAIIKSGMCANPQIDKTSVYIPIPKVTRDHREALAKTVKVRCEVHVKRMQENEKKLSRKVQDAKGLSNDLKFNTVEHVSVFQIQSMLEYVLSNLIVMIYF
jgi:ribosome recycling factor